MPRSLKRKHSPPSTPSSLKPPCRTGGAAHETDPCPGFPKPTPEECQAVRDDLLALHGFPKDFLKYRRQRLLLKQNLPDLNQSLSSSEQLYEEGGDDDDESCGQESVLDGLVGAILSQNTTEVNARRAFTSLKSSFPTWEDVCSYCIYISLGLLNFCNSCFIIKYFLKWNSWT